VVNKIRCRDGAGWESCHTIKEISMEIGKEYFEPKSTTHCPILSQALEDIKEVIKLNPQKEIVSQYTLTLLKIYDIIEEAEKQVNLHQLKLMKMDK
jgi:hypothetical protein